MAGRLYGSIEIFCLLLGTVKHWGTSQKQWGVGRNISMATYPRGQVFGAGLPWASLASPVEFPSHALALLAQAVKIGMFKQLFARQTLRRVHPQAALSSEGERTKGNLEALFICI